MKKIIYEAMSMKKVTGIRLDILQRYASGKISTGTAAKELGIPISELFDLMKELGIRYDLSYEDCLEGLKNLRKIW